MIFRIFKGVMKDKNKIKGSRYNCQQKVPILFSRSLFPCLTVSTLLQCPEISNKTNIISDFNKSRKKYPFSDKMYLKSSSEPPEPLESKNGLRGGFPIKINGQALGSQESLQDFGTSDNSGKA